MFAQIDIMTELMELHLDEQNIVKFIGWYKIVFWTKVLVFEMLDMNLKDYCSRFAPLPLWKIRPIIQQVRIHGNQIQSAAEILRVKATQYSDVVALLGGHGTQRPGADRLDPRWHPRKKHHVGGSPIGAVESQANRLRHGCPQIWWRPKHESSNIFLPVRENQADVCLLTVHFL